MRLLVCGGRKYADREFLYAKLDEYLAKFGSLCIISGKAPGADTLAEEWARERRTSFHGFRADWDKHGKGAGPIRNQRMIDKGDPHLVLAFPGGIGTEDMIARALTAHVPVVRAVVVPSQNGDTRG